MLKAGDKLPSFTLENQDGIARTLASYEGKWVVLFVYPEDDTPGCTIETRAFTASKPDFDAVGAALVGLSADDVASHKRFCGKFSLTVELLADPQKALLGPLGIGQTPWNGKLFFDRTTFLVDPSGIIRKVYEKVDPRGHEKAVLADLVALKG
jgi:peroxiredoxin Q/BCP